MLLNKIRFFPSESTLCGVERFPKLIPLVYVWIHGPSRMRRRERNMILRFSIMGRVNGSNKNCRANDVFSFLIGFALRYAMVVVIDDFSLSVDSDEECSSSPEHEHGLGWGLEI